MPTQRLFLYTCPRCNLDVPKESAQTGKCPRCGYEHVEQVDSCLNNDLFDNSDCTSCPEFEECYLGQEECSDDDEEMEEL
jgi:hypothetical protein